MLKQNLIKIQCLFLYWEAGKQSPKKEYPDTKINVLCELNCVCCRIPRKIDQEFVYSGFEKQKKQNKRGASVSLIFFSSSGSLLLASRTFNGKWAATLPFGHNSSLEYQKAKEVQSLQDNPLRENWLQRFIVAIRRVWGGIKRWSGMTWAYLALYVFFMVIVVPIFCYKLYF